MLGWALNLGFAGGGAAAPTPSPAVTTPTPAGVSRQKRNERYYVEIDGQQFFVKSAEDARQLLDQARALAERQAEEKSERTTKVLTRKARKGIVPKVEIKAPDIRVSPELRADLVPVIDDIQRLYRQAAELAEMRLLMLKAQMDEEEEDLLLLL